MNFEENPMIAIDVKCWQLLSMLSTPGSTWRIYVTILLMATLNFMQLVNLYDIWGNFGVIAYNMFFVISVFTGLLRACIVRYNRLQFEEFMNEFALMYRDIEESHEKFLKGILEEPTRYSRRISTFNLTASLLNILLLLASPLWWHSRAHPFGVSLPGIDMTSPPFYELAYGMQILVLPTLLLLTYIPFVSLFVSFAMFGKVALQVLQLRLKHICDDRKASEDQKYLGLKDCMAYYNQISRYVKEFNDLVTYIVLFDFLLYCVIICLLLFSMIFATALVQIVLSFTVICTMLYILLIYYWFASELLHESLKVPDTAFGIQWYDCSPRFKRDILNFITLTQQPLRIMLGNQYPMTMARFQSLLNSSYSYFTILRGVYKKN